MQDVCRCVLECDIAKLQDHLICDGETAVQELYAVSVVTWIVRNHSTTFLSKLKVFPTVLTLPLGTTSGTQPVLPFHYKRPLAEIWLQHPQTDSWSHKCSVESQLMNKYALSICNLIVRHSII